MIAENKNTLLNLVNSMKVRLKIRQLYRGVALILCVFLGIIITIAILDYFISFSSVLRLWLLYAMIIGLIFSIARYIVMPLMRNITDEEIALAIQAKYKNLSDDLVNALQLGRALDRELFVSRGLIEQLVENTAAKITCVDINEVAPYKRKYLLRVLAVAAVFILLTVLPPGIMKKSLPRILDPLNYERISRILKVFPGDKDILSNENLLIEAFVERKGRVELNFRKKKGDWNNIRMKQAEKQGEAATSHRFVYEFEKLAGDIEYFVKYDNVQSPVYSIRVIMLPAIGDVSLVYHYPSYTGISRMAVEDSNGDIEAIYGTKVDVIAKSNKPVEKAILVTGDNKKLSMEIKNGVELKGNLYLTGEDRYWIEVVDWQGYTNRAPVKYRITILPDEHPEVKILAPGMDMVVSEKGTIDIVCELRDDFGVKELELAWQKSTMPEPGSISIKRFNPAVDMKVHTYEWGLASLRLEPGDIVSYYLQVKDNDIISGPKKGMSRTYYLEVFSYEKEHKEIEEALADFRDRLMNILGDQIVAKDNTEKLKGEKPEGNLEDAVNMQEKVKETSGDLVDIMEKLFPRMENDPMGDWRTLKEYENITENLRRLEQSSMKEVLEELMKLPGTKPLEKDGQVDKVAGQQQDIIDELEKMALLSEDVLQNQKMQDLMDSAHDLVDRQAEFARALDELKNSADSEKMQELMSQLAEINDIMSQLQKNLKDMPKELPEEFVNQDSIKDMDMGSMENMMQKLQKSIMDGDLEAALQQTSDLLDMLSGMMDTLMEAASNVPNSNLDELSEQAGEHMKELDDIIKEQEKILEKTSALDAKRLAEMMKKQEKLIKELAELQKKAIVMAKKIPESTQGNIEGRGMEDRYKREVKSAIPVMEQVYQDLVNPPARKAMDLLGNVISKLENAEKVLADSGKLIEEEKGSALNLLEQEEGSVEEKRLEEIRENKKKDWKEKKKESEEEKQRRKEFENRKDEVITNYNDKKNNLNGVSRSLEEVLELEKKILKALKKSNSDNKSLSNSDKSLMEELARRQQELKAQAEKLGQGLKQLSKQTSAVGSEVLKSMQDGTESMGEAGQALSDSNSGSAMSSEQDALQSLLNSKEGLGSAMKQLSGMKMQMGNGMPMPGFMQPRGGHLPGGRMGFRDGKVKIPTAEDYRVPKEFRQDIMEALKENYPDVYKDMIKKYYKRLTE